MLLPVEEWCSTRRGRWRGRRGRRESDRHKKDPTAVTQSRLLQTALLYLRYASFICEREKTVLTSRSQSSLFQRHHVSTTTSAMPRRSPPTLFEASPPQQQSTGGKTNYATYSAPVLKTKYPMLVMTIPTLMGLTKLQPHQEMLRRRLLVPYNAAMRGRIMFISHQVRTPSLPSGIDLSARHREAYGHATQTHF